MSRTLQLAGLSLGFLGLSACQQLNTDPNVGPCPVAGVLFDAERLVEIQGEELHENVGFTASIEGVKGFCRYVDDNPITMEIEIDFAFGKGPKAEGNEKTFQYFVAVTRRDRVVLAKQVTPITVKFDSNKDVVRMKEKVEGIVIPRATPTVSGTNFEVLVGLELTPEQLAFNRAGKRFRMQVK